MAIPHVLVLAAALVALLCLPCAVAVLICSDDLAVRRAWARRGRADRLALRRLDRELCGAGSVPAQAHSVNARAAQAGPADAQADSAAGRAGSVDAWAGSAGASAGPATARTGFADAPAGSVDASAGFADVSPGFVDASAGFADVSPGFADASAGSVRGGGVAVPIEQLAADLRRLDRQRHSGPTTTSERWAEAVLLAYDERLKLACRYLAVDHHLSAVDGLDRDLERVRVEDELQAAGLDVRTAGRRPEG
jgi:hypothetical protein